MSAVSGNDLPRGGMPLTRDRFGEPDGGELSGPRQLLKPCPPYAVPGVIRWQE
jgi:hypothetical protein